MKHYLFLADNKSVTRIRIGDIYGDRTADSLQSVNYTIDILLQTNPKLYPVRFTSGYGKSAFTCTFLLNGYVDSSILLRACDWLGTVPEGMTVVAMTNDYESEPNHVCASIESVRDAMDSYQFLPVLVPHQ